MNLLHYGGNTSWEPANLMENQVSSYEELSCGPLLKSLVSKAGPCGWGGLVWLTALFIDFGFWEQLPGGWYQWERGRIWWGRWDPEGKQSSEVPLPDPLTLDKRWSGSHFYRDSFPPGCIWKRWQPERVLRFGKKKFYFKLLKYKLSNCHQLACASGKANIWGWAYPASAVWSTS